MFLCAYELAVDTAPVSEEVLDAAAGAVGCCCRCSLVLAAVASVIPFVVAHISCFTRTRLEGRARGELLRVGSLGVRAGDGTTRFAACCSPDRLLSSPSDGFDRDGERERTTPLASEVTALCTSCAVVATASSGRSSLFTCASQGVAPLAVTCNPLHSDSGMFCFKRSAL